MTRARATTLLVGVLVLLLLAWLRLRPQNPEAPSGQVGQLGFSQEDSSLAPNSASSLVREFAGTVMGTTYSIKGEIPDVRLLQRAKDQVQNALQDVDTRMSTYKTESEVSIFNRLPAGVRQQVSSELMEVLTLSRSLFEVSGGAFDITVGPLVRAWGFGVHPADQAPQEARLLELRRITGSQLLDINEEDLFVMKKADGVQIDLSAVAKGYGVDRASEALKKLGVDNFLVEVGGELRFSGTKPTSEGRRTPWTLAIEEPVQSGRQIHGILSAPVNGGALATSGDYRNFLEVDGEMLSHIIDPRVGRPVPRRTASVSVFRPTAAEADGLATALSVLEPDAALELADQKGWAVYLLVHRAQGGFLGRSSREFAKLSMLKP